MRHVALAIFTLALVSAQDIDDPCLDPPVPGCGCAVLVTGGIEYSCSGFDLTVSNSEMQAKIKCRGKTLDCSKLPQIPFAGNLVLDQMTLEDCSLNTSLECVMSKLNSTGVDQLMLIRHRSPIVAENFRGLGTLFKVYHYNSVAVTRISADTIKFLPSLDNLALANARVMELPSFAFANSSVKLRRLEVSMNNIPILPADAFDGLNELTILSLFLNRIQSIDENAFRGLHSLQELDLNNNQISSVPVGVFQHTPQLSYLMMSRNPELLVLKNGLLSGLNRLENLELQGSNLELDSRSLADLPSLKDVNLSDAALTELPPDLFHNSTAIVNLTLSDNKIRVLPIRVFQDQRMLQKLVLSFNNLQGVTKNTFATLYNLTEIYLNNNEIKVLTQDLFSTTIGTLKTVSFAHNQITVINWYAFRGARSITNLDLSHNQLKLNGDDDIEDNKYSVNIACQSPLYSLNELEYLDLSYNHIKSVCYDWGHVMPNLRILNLAFNNFTELSAADINITSNATVDFRNNNITKITPNTYMVTQPDLRLGNNPYNCDCHLYDFLRQLNKLPYRVEDATCNSPQSMKNMLLSTVSTDKLGDVICLLPRSVTPRGCSCISRPAMDRTECDCEGIQYLPNPAHSGLSKMLLKLTKQQNLTGLPNFVETLDLTHLKLETVPDIPKTVRHVDLSYNRLSRVPLDILNRANLTLELRNNSFNCDCEGAEDIANIQRVQKQIDGKITDFESLVCTDGFSVEGIDPPRLCYLRDATIIGTTLLGIGIFLLIVGILSYRYSLEIKIWLYHHGWTWLIKEEMLDAMKQYDIFLSFAHQDEKFVIEELLPELDKDYKVCVHTRDWNVGETIVEQIYRSVADSRRTLIVVSKAFLESMWSLEEFRAAYNQTVKDRRPRIVAILLDDVTIDAAPELIKNYLNLTTYTEWKDVMFWKKLRIALPRKIKAEDVKKRQKTAIAVKNLAKGGLNVVCNEEGKLVNLAELNKQLDIILTPKGFQDVEKSA